LGNATVRVVLNDDSFTGETRSVSFAVRVPPAPSEESPAASTSALAGRPYLWSSEESSSGLSQPLPSQIMNQPDPVSDTSRIAPVTAWPAAIPPTPSTTPSTIISQPIGGSVRIDMAAPNR
jgi:hypothetical protein